MTIYMCTTFSPYDNYTPKKYSLCRQLNRTCTSSSLQREINFSVSSSEKVVFAFVDSDLQELVATTTLSTIFKQENFTFLPYSVRICHKISLFLSVLAFKILQQFFGVHNSCRRIVGFVYMKQFM